MNIHKNARTMLYNRAEIVRRIMVLHETPSEVATALGVSERTNAKRLARHRAEGEAGLAERNLRSHAMTRATLADAVDQVIALLRQRLCGKQIWKGLGLSLATVSRVLRKVRLSLMRDLDPPEPVRRYQCSHPGEKKESAVAFPSNAHPRKSSLEAAIQSPIARSLSKRTAPSRVYLSGKSESETTSIGDPVG